MPELETHAQWRLLTRRDFTATLAGWAPAEGVGYGVGAAVGSGGRVNATELDTRQSIHRVHECIRKNIEYEHGTEAKTPRGNVYRPYRMTVGGVLAAVVVLRASEAFNVCEIDVFLTVELPGVAEGATTRAALTFALSDAVRNGGSMALQFSRACGQGTVPEYVRSVASTLGVALDHDRRGVISPTEAREVYLRLSGLGAPALARARALSELGHFSPERLAWLVASGNWPAPEAEMILLACPHPALLLGDSALPESRHLHAQAVAHARAAVMAGLFDRALRYVDPVARDATVIEERGRYLRIENTAVPDRLAWLHGPLPAARTWAGWAPHPRVQPTHPAGQRLLVLPRPRPREEIRLFLRQDLESARAAAGDFPGATALIVYPSELLELGASERLEATQAAAKRGVELLACPENLAAVDAQVELRLAAGRRLRR